MLNCDITFIFVNYKSTRDIHSLVDKLNNYSIIVVDNSNDYSLRKKEVIINLKYNLGFGRAVNEAVKYVKTNFFILLNPDIEFNYKIIEEINNINFNNKALILNKEEFNYMFANNESISFKKNNISLPLQGFYFAILSTVKFTNLNGFDDKYFMYCEDYDYQIRVIRKFGYDSIQYSKFTISHLSGKSYKGLSGKFRRLFQSYKSSLIFVKRYRHMFDLKFQNVYIIAVIMAYPKLIKWLK